jgi:hypothetical protein
MLVPVLVLVPMLVLLFMVHRLLFANHLEKSSNADTGCISGTICPDPRTVTKSNEPPYRRLATS